MPQTPVKCFDNPDFLHSASARTLRILSEYLEPKSRIERFGVRDTIGLHPCRETA